MYTLIAVYVHFNRFIDLTIYSDTNPYNLAKQVRKVHEKPSYYGAKQRRRKQDRLKSSKFLCKTTT